ncbi:MAG: hypothetical protein NXI03_10210, partial [Alphaproteobacteria bacterium]|nr:hypothetical protein [Alphaproteobacteria bacterium]
LTAMGSVIASVHRAARAEGVPGEVADDLCTLCADSIGLFAGAVPFSTADCALMCLSVKQRLDDADADDADAYAEIAADLLRIALFLGRQSGEAETIDRLAAFTASAEEMQAARGESVSGIS